MQSASSKQYDQEQDSRLDVESHGHSYCDAIKTISAAYESARIIMTIGTMTAPAQYFQQLKGPSSGGNRKMKKQPVRTWTAVY
jgi:hypothetical protein